MSATPQAPSFTYIETDIPPGMTIGQYRAARAREAKRQPSDHSLAKWMHGLVSDRSDACLTEERKLRPVQVELLNVVRLGCLEPGSRDIRAPSKAVISEAA
jgi:hypothetical protein